VGRIAAALLLLGSVACISTTPFPGVEPPGPGPTADDDDAVPAELSVDPATVQAGSYRDVQVTLRGFDLSGASVAWGASSDEVVFHGIFGPPQGDLFNMRFHFGLLAEGTYPWGLQNIDGTLLTSFDIEPMPFIFDMEPGLPAAEVELDAEQDFDAWRIVPPANHYLVARVRPGVGHELMTPLLWLMDGDGVSIVEETTEPLLVLYNGTQLDRFLRIQDADFVPTRSLELDLAYVDAGIASVVPEVEPNQAPDDWQDLGLLGPGRYTVTGVSETAGHDELNDPSGDLDVFNFELEQDSRVQFELSWETLDDIDAVLYVHEEGQTELGFQSPSAVDMSMSSLARPESADLQLDAGGRYTFMVANWEGEPEIPWVLSLNVYPGEFPEEMFDQGL